MTRDELIETLETACEAGYQAAWTAGASGKDSRRYQAEALLAALDAAALAVVSAQERILIDDVLNAVRRWYDADCFMGDSVDIDLADAHCALRKFCEAMLAAGRVDQ